MRRLVIRTLATALATSAMVIVPLTVTAPAEADVKTDRACKVGEYKTNYRITSSYRAPAITHIKTWGVGPGGTRTVTREVAFNQQISAAVKYTSGGSVEAGLPGKILGKAEAHMSLELAANGSRTKSGTSTVTDTVSNKTNRNVQYVFYKGVTKANGSFRKYYCKFYYLPGVNYGYARVTYKPGKWRSYAIPGEGAVRCGAGTSGLGALARAALKLGCPA